MLTNVAQTLGQTFIMSVNLPPREAKPSRIWPFLTMLFGLPGRLVRSLLEYRRQAVLNREIAALPGHIRDDLNLCRAPAISYTDYGFLGLGYHHPQSVWSRRHQG